MEKRYCVYEPYSDTFYEWFGSLDDAMEYCEEFDFIEYSLIRYEYFPKNNIWYIVFYNEDDADDEFVFAIADYNVFHIEVH